MAKTSERASKGVSEGKTVEQMVNSRLSDAVIAATVEPVKENLEKLLEKAESVPNDDELVWSKETPPWFKIVISNQIMIMKSHIAIMERMAGDINMAEALKKQIKVAEEF